jgi:hypothetical protein
MPQARKSYKVIAPYDTGRPWLEEYHIKPERRWLNKIRKAKKIRTILNIDVNQLPIKIPQLSQWNTKLVKNLKKLVWSGTEEDRELMKRSKDSSSLMARKWARMKHLFYTWTEEELDQRKLNVAMQREVAQGRFRMLRIRDLYQRVDGDQELAVKRQVDRLFDPPLDLMFDASPYSDEYFHWVLKKDIQKRERIMLLNSRNQKKSMSEDEKREDAMEIALESNRLSNASPLTRVPKDPYIFGKVRYLKERFWKGRSYSQLMFRGLLELEVDSILGRQPKRNFITEGQYKRLQYHQAALAAYHRSLRDYNQSIWKAILDPRGERFDRNTKDEGQPSSKWKDEKGTEWQLGFGAKSLENYVYAQRFRGSFRVVQRLFPLDYDWNVDGRSFRYDQLLPLEDQDKGNQSNLWHEEIPQKIREEVGAYDAFDSKRVAPMFDPVPFYIGWDRLLRKSVLTTSRLPYGTPHVKLVLPSLEKENKFDFLGIQRFLEETKLYEHVDFVADADHQFFVHLRDRQMYYLNQKKEKVQKASKFYPPSSVRRNPMKQWITPAFESSRVPTASYNYGLYQRMEEAARKYRLSTKNYPYRYTPENVPKILEKLKRKRDKEESLRQSKLAKKSLISERSSFQILSPKTVFSLPPEKGSS